MILKGASIRSSSDLDDLSLQDERPGDPLFVQSVEKAFRIVLAFDAAHPTMGLTQLAKATGLERSAVQRFAHTLQKLGYLRKDPVTRHFRLTSRTLGPAHRYTETDPLIRLATPYLIDLRRETGETVSLTVLEGAEVVYVVRLLSAHSLATRVTVGARVPAYCTAAGLVMLSRLPECDARTILEASEMRTMTRNTTIAIPKILERLTAIRSQGYVTCVDEYVMNDITIGTSIFRADDTPIGSITIGTTHDRHTPGEAEQKYANRLLTLSRVLSTL